MNIVRDIFVKKASNAQLLARLNSLINSSAPALAKFLVSNWQNQANAITYKELREMIESGNFDTKIFSQWQQDYSLFVTRSLLPVWKNAIEQASKEYKRKYKGFYFDSTEIGVRIWNEKNAARFVTDCTSQQIDALAAVIRQATELEGMSSTGLAKVIRPMIGLNKPQAEANMRFYNSLIENGVSEKRAREQSIKYSAIQQRYRALMIARTEIATSYNEGRDIAVKQAQKQGLVGNCRRVWITADTERTCEYCASLDGTDVGMDDDFIMEIGKKVRHAVNVSCPPAHPHCMCVLNYEEVDPPIVNYEENIKPGNSSGENFLNIFTSDDIGGIINTNTIQGDKLPSYTSRGLDLPDRVVDYLDRLSKTPYIEGAVGTFDINDLPIMSRETNTEFAVISCGEKSYLIKGMELATQIPNEIFDKLTKEKGTLDYHSHPFTSDTIPSISDMRIMEKLPWQEQSLIIDESGKITSYNRYGIIQTDITSNTQLQEDMQSYYESLFGGG